MTTAGKKRVEKQKKTQNLSHNILTPIIENEESIKREIMQFAQSWNVQSFEWEPSEEEWEIASFFYQKIINELSDVVCHRLGFIRFINFLRNHTLNGWIIFMGQLKVSGCNLAKSFCGPLCRQST